MKKFMPWVYIIGISVLLAGGLFALSRNETNVNYERATINQEYQSTWRSISANIDSILPLANLITEEYSNVTELQAVHKNFVQANIKTKGTNVKQDKFDGYKEVVELIDEIKANKDDERVKDNKIIQTGLKNMDKYIQVVDVLKKDYNKSIERYNDTFTPIFKLINKVEVQTPLK